MPNSVLSPRRSWIARIAVLAMLASLLAIGAVPAGAATPACPDSVPSSNFADLGGFDAETVDAVDCLVAYGIAQGTSATTFNPNGEVTRWQMALFLTRQAVDHGVTLPSGADQGFTDIGALDAATQTAINQLKQLGITQGTSATTFDPNGTVPRWQMALFLTRLVTGAGVTLPSGASQGFTDIASYDTATQTAINQTAQLAISKGTSTTTFDPASNVTRWQMALFLSRTLAADGLVFPGVVLMADVATQATSGDVKLTVYVGNANNSPAEGQRIEVIAAKDFNTDGTVKTYAADDLGGSGAATGTTDSTIDLGDPVADATGKVSVTLKSTVDTAHTTEVVAWIGTVGQAYTKDRTQAKVTVTWTAGAVDIELTTDDDSTGVNLNGGTDSYSPFGQDEGFTIQLLGSDDKAVPIAGAKFQLTREVYSDADETAAPGADQIASSVQVVQTDANGAYSESHNFADPNASKDSITYALIHIVWDTDNDGLFSDEGNHSDVYLEWNDAKAVATNVDLDGPDVADQDGFATVTVSVTDQYGDPCSSGCLVRFDWSNDDAAGFESGDQRTLNASGQASITIGGPGSNLAADNDTVSVRVDGDDNTTGWQDPGADDATHLVQWYDDAANNLGAAAGIVVLDTTTASDSFVGLFSGANWKFVYDADDQFAVLGAADTLAGFEAELSDTDVITANYDRDGTAPDVSTWNITTNN